MRKSNVELKNRYCGQPQRNESNEKRKLDSWIQTSEWFAQTCNYAKRGKIRMMRGVGRLSRISWVTTRQLGQADL